MFWKLLKNLSEHENGPILKSSPTLLKYISDPTGIHFLRDGLQNEKVVFLKIMRA